MQFRFDSLAEFIQMAGHGPYVWACYLAGLLAISYILMSPGLKTKALRQQAEQMHKRRSQAAKSETPAR